MRVEVVVGRAQVPDLGHIDRGGSCVEQVWQTSKKNPWALLEIPNMLLIKAANKDNPMDETGVMQFGKNLPIVLNY